jgi:hypothetical protein
MKRLDARLDALEARTPACVRCAGLPPTVVIEGGTDEIADRAYIERHLPYPRECPACGRRTIRLIRAYGTGNPQAREGEHDGGGI